MARKRKRPDEGGGGGYSWMDTYGDLVTLLLCFFVMLLAMSNTDEAKIKEIVQSFSGIPRPVAVPFDPGLPNMEDEVQVPEDIRGKPGDGEDRMNQLNSLEEQDRRFWELYEKLREYVNEAGLEGQVDVQKGDFSITLRFMDSVFFDSGKYELKSGSAEIIDQLIPFLDQNVDVIESLRIEGHTDNQPINQSVLRNNWWLSLYRAGSVVDYLHDYSAFDPAKITAVGLGEYHPIDANDTQEGRARNRRVEFVIEEKKSLQGAGVGQGTQDGGIGATEPPAQFPTPTPGVGGDPSAAPEPGAGIGPEGTSERDAATPDPNAAARTDGALESPVPGKGPAQRQSNAAEGKAELPETAAQVPPADVARAAANAPPERGMDAYDEGPTSHVKAASVPGQTEPESTRRITPTPSASANQSASKTAAPALRVRGR